MRRILSACLLFVMATGVASAQAAKREAQRLYTYQILGMFCKKASQIERWVELNVKNPGWTPRQSMEATNREAGEVACTFQWLTFTEPKLVQGKMVDGARLVIYEAQTANGPRFGIIMEPRKYKNA